MSGSVEALSWTAGGTAILLQACPACARRWAFQRSFCPGCGRAGPHVLRASGEGTVHARSLVHRAATPETKRHAPYLILLVDLEEGVRIMAHGDPDLAIGERVVLGVRDFAGGRVPHARRA
jgi:uncharacterized OB-fold protein